MSACIVRTYAVAVVSSTSTPLRGEEREVVEAPEAGRRRRHGEREVPDPLEQEVRAELEVEVERVADDREHRDVGEPHERRRAR